MKKTKKSYIVRLDAISQDNADFYESTSCGCFVYDFTDVDGESLFKASKGYTLEQCKKFAGKKLILAYSAIQSRRVYVLPEFFPEEVLRGTFNYDAIRQYNEPEGANYIINSRKTYPFFCTACGKQLTENDGKTHNCLASDICRVCGAKLTTDSEEKAHMCKHCFEKMYNVQYDYHGRKNRVKPLFESPKKREKLLHIGAEIEVNQTDDEATKNVKNFGRILNKDCYAFAEFERDGSLVNGGCEIITAPTTVNGYYKRYADIDAFYKKAIEEDCVFGVIDSEMNGLHFHLDREFFEGASVPAAGIIQYIIYSNYQFFASISHRDKYHLDYACNVDSRKEIDASYRNATTSNHEYAVNVSNAGTLELRIFGGKIDTANKFFAALDITQAIATYAKKTPTYKVKNFKLADLIKYLRDPSNVAAFVRDVSRSDAAYFEEAKADREAFATACDEAAEKLTKGGKN